MAFKVPGGTSALNVWWMRLGIRPERIEPSRPEQDGAHERMHRTLKAEKTRPPAATRVGQQRKFEAFRYTYNHERPHEALGQQPPARPRQPSSRAYPRAARRPITPAITCHGMAERANVALPGKSAPPHRRVGPGDQVPSSFSKCYPCPRSDLLPMFPVEQNRAGPLDWVVRRRRHRPLHQRRPRRRLASLT
jgi:hypothetical protein